jgi:hypothetical protein
VKQAAPEKKNGGTKVRPLDRKMLPVLFCLFTGSGNSKRIRKSTLEKGLLQNSFF